MSRAPSPDSGLPHLARGARGAVALVGLLLAAGAPLDAQEPAPRVPSGPDTIRAVALSDTAAVPARGVSPRGAFLRAVAVPGWGHAAIGAHHRGAFYFVVEGATAWTLLRTRRRFDEAGDRVRFREETLRRDLAARGISDEAEIQRRLDGDAVLEDLRDLHESRRQQREDWTAVGIFLVLLSGVDAFVSAHLRDFPVPLQVDARPAGDGRMDLSVGFTLPR